MRVKMSVFFYLFTDCFFLKRSVFFFLCEFPMNLGYLFGFTYVSHSLLSFSFFSWFSDFFFFSKTVECILAYFPLFIGLGKSDGKFLRFLIYFTFLGVLGVLLRNSIVSQQLFRVSTTFVISPRFFWDLAIFFCHINQMVEWSHSRRTFDFLLLMKKKTKYS